LDHIPSSNLNVIVNCCKTYDEAGVIWNYYSGIHQKTKHMLISWNNRVWHHFRRYWWCCGVKVWPRCGHLVQRLHY